MAREAVSNETLDQPRRPGRPTKAGSSLDNARTLIVAAAAREFSTEGYDTTSMRGIARSAGVDPALVRHYFSNKAELFAEAIGAPMRHDRLVAHALAGSPDEIGANLVRYVVRTLDDPATGERVVRLLHTALGQKFAARMLSEFMIREVLTPLATELGDDSDAELRAAFAATQIVGLVVSRYGLDLAPLTSASVDDVVARVGPVVQAHLVGTPLP